VTRILLSYRRSDAAAMTGRIFDKLAGRYGSAAVFMDVDSIPVGVDFRAHVQSALQDSDILVAIIGPKWPGPLPDGRSRIMEPADPVRVEIESALAKGVRIVPVLVDGAAMPTPESLPATLAAEFPFFNAAQVDAGRDFHPHMDRLIRSLDQMLGNAATGMGEPAEAIGVSDHASDRREPWRLPAILFGVACLVSAAVYFGLFRSSLFNPRNQGNTAVTARLETNSLPLPAEANYCNLLKAIVPLAADEFKSILDNPTGERSWTTTQPLKGWARCYIADISDVTYVCEDADVETRAQAEAAMGRRRTEVAECLGSDWMFEESGGFLHNLAGDMISFQVGSSSKTSPGAGPDDINFAPGGKFSVNLMLRRAFSRKANAIRFEAPSASPKGFCPELKKVIISARTGFQSIIGVKRDPFWTSKMQLPGFFDCEIAPLDYSGPRRYYSCSGPPLTDNSAVKTMLEDVSSEVKTCLGENWTSHDRFNANNELVRTFDGTTGNLDIELRAARSYDRLYKVRIDVNMQRVSK
jgi:hypothetical protein